MDNRPIGVFDSGIGGLTVVKEIMEQLPGESIVYIGDTARVPYGTKSKETVTKFTFQCIRFLLTKNIKAVVIACNTASASSLLEAKAHFEIPIIGVVEPGAKSAAANTRTKRVGVIGTEGTVNSKAYEKEINKIDANIKIYAKPCPLFVPIVEEGWYNSQVATIVAEEYLKELKEMNIDSLVMGCTHYPLLRETLSKVMGEGVSLINPARETAEEVKIVLRQKGLLREDLREKPYYRYFVSDNPVKFKKVGEDFLKKDIKYIERIDIEEF